MEANILLISNSEIGFVSLFIVLLKLISKVKTNKAEKKGRKGIRTARSTKEFI